MGVVFCSPAGVAPREGAEIQGRTELCSGCVTGAQATEGGWEPEGLGSNSDSPSCVSSGQ